MNRLTRRSMLALGAAAPLALQAAGKKRHVPIGVLLFAVQKNVETDMPGTLHLVKEMGYDGVEFSRYIDWTPEKAKEIRKSMDSLGLTCYSTHNEPEVFPGRLDHAIEINHILGSKTVSCVRGLAAKPGATGFQASGIEGWKKLTAILQASAEKLKQEKLRCGFHNHAVEFDTLDGQRPIDILASGAPDLYFQTDIWTCSRHADPVAFLKQYPKRHDCILVTDGSPAKGEPTLLGDGDMPWPAVFAAAENEGDVRFYLIAQEGGTTLPAMDAIQKDLEAFRKLHAW